MHSSMSDVQTEHERLSTALTRLHEQQTSSDQAHAALELFDAVNHAERALTVLLPQAESGDTAFQVRVLGLRTLTFVAYDELRRIQAYAMKVLGQRVSTRSRQLLDTKIPAGTILSCPDADCGHGLYKVTARCTTADIVLDDGQLLSPLNRTIPPRAAWHALSCVFCGSRVFQGGQIHTFQEGWK